VKLPACGVEPHRFVFLFVLNEHDRRANSSGLRGDTVDSLNDSFDVECGPLPLAECVLNVDDEESSGHGEV